MNRAASHRWELLEQRPDVEVRLKRELGVSNEELTFREKLGDHKRETIVVTDVPEDFINELKADKEEKA